MAVLSREFIRHFVMNNEAKFVLQTLLIDDPDK